jgi:hypothetical protein
MARRGYLEGSERASAFRMLQAYSLIWHDVVHPCLWLNEAELQSGK